MHGNNLDVDIHTRVQVQVLILSMPRSCMLEIHNPQPALETTSALGKRRVPVDNRRRFESGQAGGAEPNHNSPIAKALRTLRGNPKGNGFLPGLSVNDERDVVA
jgi:hypothetical protein